MSDGERESVAPQIGVPAVPAAPYDGAVATLRTERLELSRPVDDDIDALFALLSDREIWRHAPEMLQTEVAQTRAMVQRWNADWDALGLGVWILRRHDDDRIIGFAGFTRVASIALNVVSGLFPDAQGRGFAEEASRRAQSLAAERHPEMPIVVYLFAEHYALAKVQRLADLSLMHREPVATGDDAPDVRVLMLYADRPLSPAIVSTLVRHITAPYRARHLLG